jgi:calcineurin-like phosphoesterase family protein
MGKIFLTSDTHFNHLNILKYEPETRPFSSVEDMNEAIIANWNSVVSPEDTVYHLGDFFMGRYDAIEGILDRLNGTIKLIRGNHDTKARLDLYKARGIEVKELDYINYKGRFFILCHFPNNSEEFIRMITHDNSEVVWCYGHVHSNAPEGYHDGTFHVGMDTNNLVPISIEEIWSQCWPEEIMTPEIQHYKDSHDKGCLCGTCSSSKHCFIRKYGEPKSDCELFTE